MRILLAIGVVLASLVMLPYILRTWPGLPWDIFKFAFVAAVVLLVIGADRVYVLRRSRRS